jgi:hypothetical protein
MFPWNWSEHSLLGYAALAPVILINTVTDLLKALLGNGSLNTFQHTRVQQNSRRGVFFVARAETVC